MDFDFLPEIAAVNVESSLIHETDTETDFETDTETAVSNQNFESSGSNSEQQLWGKQINELSSIIANYDPTKPAPPFLMFAAEIASWHEGVKNKDIRPQVQDQISKEWLLVDSGAQVSVWPRNRVPDAIIDPYVSIRAVNKTKILTYGKKEISVRFGRKQYNHTVLIADVDRPVLGWDFCKKFRLLWNRSL